MRTGKPGTRKAETARGDAGDRPAARVLVADDEESMRYFVRRALQRHGFEVRVAESGEQAVERFGARPFDVVVLDLKMPGMDGLETLARIREQDPESVVILMTAYGTIPSAVEAMRRGAFDYVTKPFEGDELALLLERALEHRATRRENRELRRMIDNHTAYAGLIGQSPAMRAVFQTIDLLSGSSANVLITGESGTGKELVARAIHMQSARGEGPFVPLHCAALPESLLENELFGHVPGAFSGADKPKQGLLAKADGGTLFLDEVSEISLQAQAKVARFFQEREYTPLGSADPVHVDIRVIAATNRDLERAVEEGTFRRELYFRLNVVPIHLPPLRERREDVPALVNHYVERFRESQARAVRGFTVDAMILLTNYPWPGNVRELQNTIERLVVLNAGKEVIDAEDLPIELRDTSGVRRRGLQQYGALPYHEAVLAFEREYLTKLFERTGGNISETARIAGLSRGHLHRKIKQLEIDPDRFRGAGPTG